MEIKKLISVHIGLFGHIDSGKTALASVLSEIISTAGIDGHPQSKERGITIDLGFTSFVLDNFLITLVDGPGHADLIKISASSVEIIDFAILVIDINKGPQVQTGEHLIMIESLNIDKVVIILNKIDLFTGDIENEIEKTKRFFKSTSFGANLPIFAVSSKNGEGFEELKKGILETIQTLNLRREVYGDLIIPIDHHFSIKGRGAIITGTILRGRVEINQNIEIVPINSSGRVKNIQIFRQDVSNAQAGDRVGINLKNVSVKNIFRGCYATNRSEAFDYYNILDVHINKNNLFKPETHFGTQIHVTIGMFTTVGNIYPYRELNGKMIQSSASNKDTDFNAIIWLQEKILIYKKKAVMLISRLDLPPTTLRILGSAELLKGYKESPIFYKYKVKEGRIQNPNHSQGIVCTGLAQSAIGARKVLGKKLEPPFSKILGTFGTKGAVIIGTESKELTVSKGDTVRMKELRSFRLKPKKDLNSRKL